MIKEILLARHFDNLTLDFGTHFKFRNNGKDLSFLSRYERIFLDYRLSHVKANNFIESKVTK